MVIGCHMKSERFLVASPAQHAREGGREAAGLNCCGAARELDYSPNTYNTVGATLLVEF
jgi:hypothetical protein